MASRTLGQIVSELNPTYAPQINSIKQQVAAVPAQIAAEEKGLEAKQQSAFGDILSGARRRGLGFSGIPLAEQAQYTASEFLPSLARLKQSGVERQTSLQDAINQIYERRNTLAQQLRQQEVDRAEQVRQFNENMRLQRDQLAAQRAASAGAAGPSFSLGDMGMNAPSGGGAVKSATAVKRKDGGFNFTDANGRAISAAAYAAAKGIPFRNLLQTMAKAGDKGANTALGFVGNDFGYDPRKVANSNLASLYNSLVWGTGRTAKPTARPAQGNKVTYSAIRGDTGMLRR